MTGLRIEPLASERGFRLSGELDLYTVEAARAALEHELHGTLVLDLTELEFIDDSGLGVLVSSFKRMRDEGGELLLRNPAGAVRRVFEVTGLDQLPWFTVEPGEDRTQGTPPAAPE